MSTTLNYTTMKSAPIKIGTFTDKHFKEMTPDNSRLRVLPMGNREALITWNNIPEEHAVSVGYLQKSYTIGSQWTTLTVWHPGEIQEYYDEAFNKTILRHGVVFYRLVFPEIQTVVGPASPESRIDPVGLEIARREKIKLQQGLCGAPCYIFVRMRNEQTRCPDCWDEIFQKTTKGDCPTCKGTGFLVGYYRPIKTYVSFPSPETVNIQNLEDGPSNVEGTIQTWMSNYPVVTTGDILVEAGSMRLWYIKAISLTTHNRVPIRQTMQIEYCDGDDQVLALIKELPRGEDDAFRRYAYSQTGQGVFSPSSEKVLRERL